MRPKQLTMLGICVLAGACDPNAVGQTEGTLEQALIPGAPMTVDARLIEQSNGKWRLVCMGRFRNLGVGDLHAYQGNVAFFQEGAQVALLGGTVTTASPTVSKGPSGSFLTITHPSADPAGSLTVRMVRGPVDPRRRHSCQVIVRRDGVEVMRTEGRPARPVVKPLGSFADTGQTLGNHGTGAIALGDLDGDGDVDSFEGNHGPAGFGVGQPNRVRRNNGQGVFTDTGQAIGNGVTFSVALGDLDADGDLDAFEGNFGQSNRIFRNNGAGVFADTGQALSSSSTTSIALGDLDGDGDLDAYEGTGVNFSPDRFWINNGSGTFTGSNVTGSESDTMALALGDLDGDGDLDVFEGNGYDSPQPSRIWLNNAGTFTDSGQWLSYGITASVALGDLDGDGDIDAFVGNFNQGNRVFLNNGSAIFTDSNQAIGDHATRSVALGDVDGDTDLDVFEVNANQANRVWFNNGDGTFPSSVALGSHNSVAAALADLDGDGDLDAFAGIYNQGNRVWQNQ